jgi:uncharacterized protein YkwD
VGVSNLTPVPMRKGTIRGLSLAFVATAALVLATAASGGSTTREATLDVLLLREINALRSSHGLAPLRPSAGLTAAASEHSLEMARDGYFAHESRDGSPFWKRVERFYGSRRDGYRSVGENLAWASPSLDPSSTLRLWLAEPQHRANLLDPRWREFGAAAVHHAGAAGVFGGRAFTVVTADFARS